MSFPPNIDHGKKGRIRVFSEWNTDRQPPSRQVWVAKLDARGRDLNTSSGTLVSDLGRVDGDGRHSDYHLTAEELAFVDKIYEEFECRRT